MMSFTPFTPFAPMTPRVASCRVLLVLMAIAVAACSTTAEIEDPIATLNTTGLSPRLYRAALVEIDALPPDEASLAALHRIVWASGYSVELREEAVRRLAVQDLDGLKRTLRQRLPRMNAPAGLRRLCAIIAEEGWVDLTPALVSSWARGAPIPDDERAEYRALVELHGAEAVPDVVFDLMLESNRPSQQGLRTRCWTLLQRIGERERLVALVSEREVPADDAFLVDLQAGARELGLVPANREEILWMRQLRTPERRGFWNEAVVAVGPLPAARRRDLELRDLPVVVAAARHDPDLLDAELSVLYDELAAALTGRRHYAHGSNFDNFNVGRRDRLHHFRGELTWGDLAAMLLALRALEVPQVVAHLFDFAERDRLDESTEYGGVMALDAMGRFELLEFLPRLRDHDQRFNASQAMLDAAYTALFHFHFHAQKYRNAEYAGPGFGDAIYADNLRANCLVFTFVAKDRMNVDFYRHGRVSVDLGVVQRAAPASGRASGRGARRGAASTAARSSRPGLLSP